MEATYSSARNSFPTQRPYGTGGPQAFSGIQNSRGSVAVPGTVQAALPLGPHDRTGSIRKAVVLEKEAT